MGRVFRILVISAICALVIFWLAVPSVCDFGAVRSKVSRVRSDLRSLATGLEAYANDNEAYPAGVPFTAMMPGTASRLPKTGEHLFTVPRAITTPVGYLSLLPADRFQRDGSLGLGYAYYNDAGGWILFSPGPDQDYDITDPARVYDSETTQPSLLLIGGPWTYDPTNGTESSGDVWRVKQ